MNLSLNRFSRVTIPNRPAPANDAPAAAPIALTDSTVPTLTSIEAASAARVARCMVATRVSARSASRERTRSLRSPRSSCWMVL